MVSLHTYKPLPNQPRSKLDCRTPNSELTFNGTSPVIYKVGVAWIANASVPSGTRHFMNECCENECWIKKSFWFSNSNRPVARIYFFKTLERSSGSIWKSSLQNLWENSKRPNFRSLLYELSSRFWGLDFHIKQDDFPKWRNKSDTSCSSKLEIQNDFFIQHSFSQHSFIKWRVPDGTGALAIHATPTLYITHWLSDNIHYAL